MARVMLIGDSIRNSYQPFVSESLAAEGHEVWGAPGNSQYTLYTLGALNMWLGEFTDPDVVHWNNGLHDVGHNPKRAPVQMPLEIYTGNLRFIGERLLETGATVVFASTTPVHPDRPFRDDVWSWRNDEIDRYNDGARGVMSALGIRVNELHALIAGSEDRLLSEDRLHLNEEGQRACAAEVVDAVREALRERAAL